MSLIDRRSFLSLGGGTAALGVLTLAGCGGGGGDEEAPSIAVIEAEAPMRASIGGPQFQVLPRTHSLAVTGTDGRVKRYGGVGKAQGKLNYPAGLVVINGLAYVVETGNHRVQMFDANGRSRGTIGEGSLFYPSAIAAGLNEILVSDSRNARIVGFDLSGRVTRIIGAGVLSAPRGLAVSGNGVVVADPGLRKVLQLGGNGRVLAEIGTDWVLPWGVAMVGQMAYVADASRNEIGVVSPSGKRMSSLPLKFAPANVAFQNGSLLATPQV